ncbi:hypothetical protein CBS101457_004412 [Exobasidium rhododendri]|nr:hypothetical protein CBS101457_004412 [Exobasidium rhododendri]
MYGSGSKDDRSRPVAASNSPTQKLLVEGLHYEITEAELDYDRSGRSSGTATVIYKDVGHAINAKREYDGANAKGQPIKISYEVFRERQPRDTDGAPSGNGSALKGSDLLARLSGGDLGSRLGGGGGV